MTQFVKNPPAMQKTRVQSLGWIDSPEGRHGNQLQYFHLENSHGKRSLVDCSPWGHKESDMTERLSIAQHTQWALGRERIVMQLLNLPYLPI